MRAGPHNNVLRDIANCLAPLHTLRSPANIAEQMSLQPMIIAFSDRLLSCSAEP